MPGRKVFLATGETYHVFNRGIASQPTYLNKRDYERAINYLFYYHNKTPPLKYSHFIVQSLEKRQSILQSLKDKKDLLVDIIAYCLMPNHFHLLLRQRVEHGISKYLANITNSYTRYFNTKNKRNGPLFQGKFSAVRIETDEQFVHICRYIHLNPYTSYILKNPQDLEQYPYSSFPEYLGKTEISFCYKEDILINFKNKTSFKKFIYNQADYQRKLNKIKHLAFDN